MSAGFNFGSSVDFVPNNFSGLNLASGTSESWADQLTNVIKAAGATASGIITAINAPGTSKSNVPTSAQPGAAGASGPTKTAISATGWQTILLVGAGVALVGALVYSLVKK